MGKLYFGDNLAILREYIQTESIDLIYLDPPFNSKRDYNVFLKTPKGYESDAQITAFDDTWRWGEQAEREFAELLHQSNTDAAEMIQSLRRFLKESDMMAYLVMMANRLLELHRVLKSSGSLYLHCDPTASHYLKIVLDTVFGAGNYLNEIIWKRSGSHGGAKRWGPLHDTIFLYSKSANFTWNRVFEKYDEAYLDKFYRFSDERGRYQLVTLTGAGTRMGDSGKPWRGVNPTTTGRHWAVPLGALRTIADEKSVQGLSTQEKLDLLDSAGLIYWPQKGAGIPRQKRYMDEAEGVSIQDVITDILPISSQASERLGYPTQKPLGLLERIIRASSNEGEIVLDPFCGCGTAVHAAQTLKRGWVGIDITHLAISLIEKRMKDAFPGISFEVHGTPRDLDGARNLAERDKYQFQWWACSLVNAQPYQGKKKGADGGIDGLIFFQDDEKSAKKVVVSVKGGENVGVTQIRDLIATVEKEKAAIGLFVTLAEPTKPMLTEALSTGFYESLYMGAFPKIQILTIADLLLGKTKPNYPDLARGGLNFRKARTEQKKATQLGLEGLE